VEEARPPEIARGWARATSHLPIGKVAPQHHHGASPTRFLAQRRVHEAVFRLRLRHLQVQPRRNCEISLTIPSVSRIFCHSSSACPAGSWIRPRGPLLQPWK